MLVFIQCIGSVVPKPVTLVSKKTVVLKLILMALRFVKNTVQVNKQCELNLRVNKLENMEFTAVVQGKVYISIFVNE